MSFIGGALKVIVFLVVIAVVAYGGYIYGQMTLQESLFEVSVPINQTFGFEINQSIDIPIKTTVDFPFSEYFVINESVPIIASIELDEVIQIPLSLPTGNTIVDVPIKKTIPINTSISVYKRVSIVKNISLDIDKQFTFIINKNVSVPIDMEVVTKVPVPEWMKKD